MASNKKADYVNKKSKNTAILNANIEEDNSTTEINEIEYDFVSDCVEKSKACPKALITKFDPIPTPAEVKRKSGEVITYSIGNAITWDEYMTYPDDIKKEYIKWIHEHYQLVTKADVYTDLFGKRPTVKEKVIEEIIPKSKPGKKTESEARCKEQFRKNFCRVDIKKEEETKSTLKANNIFSKLSFCELECKAKDIPELLKALGMENMEVTVKISKEANTVEIRK